MPTIRRNRTARQQLDLIKNLIRIKVGDSSGLDQNQLVTDLITQGFTNQQITTALTELQNESLIQIDP